MAPLFTGLRLGFGRSATITYSYSATGGATYEPGNGYKYHIFTYPNSDSFVVSGGEINIESLIVSGGGSGGTFSPSRAGGGGGGGAGGIAHINGATITPGIYPVTVGDGGTGVTAFNTNGNPGGDSSFLSVTALGGGGGGANGLPFADPDAGSGGGAGSNRNSPPSGKSYTGDTGKQPTYPQPAPLTPFITQYGNNGGNAYANPPYSSGVSENGGGGGGGAGSNGTSASPPSTYGSGGNGQPFPQFAYPLIGLSPLNPYSPTNDHYGGGGASGNTDTATGGYGGGGDSGYPGTAGVDNLGGGGSSPSFPTRPTVNDGGSGIVIIRYLV